MGEALTANAQERKAARANMVLEVNDTRLVEKEGCRKNQRKSFGERKNFKRPAKEQLVIGRDRALPGAT